MPEETVTTAAMEEGRRELESVAMDVRSPKFGGCWTEALTELENGCSSLTDDEQARLALLFANCFQSVLVDCFGVHLEEKSSPTLLFSAIQPKSRWPLGGSLPPSWTDDRLIVHAFFGSYIYLFGRNYLAAILTLV